MKIKKVEPIAVSIPMLKPIKMAGVELKSTDNVGVGVDEKLVRKFTVER